MSAADNSVTERLIHTDRIRLYSESDFFVGSLIPLFWTSGDVWPRISKAGWIPHLHALSPVCNGFLRFSSGATPADVLSASMVAMPFQSTYLQIMWWGFEPKTNWACCSKQSHSFGSTYTQFTSSQVSVRPRLSQCEHTVMDSSHLFGINATPIPPATQCFHMVIAEIGGCGHSHAVPSKILATSITFKVWALQCEWALFILYREELKCDVVTVHAGSSRLLHTIVGAEGDNKMLHWTYCPFTSE